MIMIPNLLCGVRLVGSVVVVVAVVRKMAVRGCLFLYSRLPLSTAFAITIPTLPFKMAVALQSLSRVEFTSQTPLAWRQSFLDGCPLGLAQHRCANVLVTTARFSDELPGPGR